MQPKPIISTDNVNRIFHSGGETIHALRDITLDVLPGTLTVLKGRSGSGKTTLMNILGALDKPNDGKVFFGGREITAMPEVQRDTLRLKDIGFVFQSVALISSMSAYENVEFSLRLSGAPRKEWKPRVEQQRVAIARAIAHRPRVIFADEPTAELDTMMGLQVMKLFRQLVRKEGITIVMTTHDPNMMELADHVYSLEDGAIVEETFNTFPEEVGEAL